MFHVADYVIFCATLCTSALIGVYFGCFGNKNKSINEYLFANRNMGVLPIALSLYSSSVSAVAILGLPSEIYMFGTQYSAVFIGIFCSMFVTWYFILPIFCGSIHFNTPYEYYELRFSSAVRNLCSVIYILNVLLYIPIVLLSICLVVNQTTEINLITCIIVIGNTCIFYTMLGGFKSVIWTDVLQAIIILFSIICIFTISVIKLGGISRIWEIADQGQRIQFFNMDPNPFVRLTFWSGSFGSIFFSAAHSGCSASSLQRYMTLRLNKQGKLCTFISYLCIISVSTISTIIGLCMYTFYYNCDPLSNKEVENANQIMPKFITAIVGDIPGISGLFFAGVLSASLGTISSELNTISGLIYYDFLLKYSKHNFIKDKEVFIMKLIILNTGMLILIFTPILRKVQYILQLANLLTSVLYGPKLGILLLGTTFPKSNSYGVICGSITALIVSVWLSIGSLLYNVTKPFVLPLSTQNCSSEVNLTSEFTLAANFTTEIYTTINADEPFLLYKLSFMLYPLLGTMITIGVGLVVSYLTGPTDLNKLDPRLIIPCLRPHQINTHDNK